ncbi:TIGR03773 family transporter-associated surface protein [Streptomyces sp. NPDC047046]|uniref:TIGR03773 family transporter-associated surface protein n=1 Tax=Streptomyces sp. NPDC047046 TaxID=3155378 RepID=UPI0034045F5E
MRTQRSARWAALGAVGSVALAAGLAPAASAGQETTTPHGPDVVLALHEGKPTLNLRQEGDNSAIDKGDSPADLVVGAEAARLVPDEPAAVFLGQPGNRVWILDGARGEGAAPRWDTGGVPAEQLADGTVEWALTGIEGPGDVKVFETVPDERDTELSSSRVLFDSADGLPDARRLPAAGSGTVSWAFTEPGAYRLTSTATARLATGETAVAETEWTVRVEDVPSAETPQPAPSAATPAPHASDGRRQENEKSEATVGTRSLTAPVRAPALAPALAPAAPSAEAIADRKTVIDDGHVDAIAGKMVDGKLRTLFKDSRNPAAPVWREPSSVVLHVDTDAKEKVPANSAYSFLGKAGADFWLIPQVQKQGVVWAGWNTEELDSGDLKGPVDMTMIKVSGPGQVAIWETAGLGNAEVLYNSADGLPDTTEVNLGVHAHGNWGFSKEGVYKVTFRLSGTLANGRAASDTRTYTFAVGDVDPNAVNPGGTTGDGGSTSGSATDDGAGASLGTGGQNGTGGSKSTGEANGAGTANGSLAHTGAAPAGALAAGAGALLLTGGAALVLVRRKRATVAAGADPRP